MLTVRSAFAQRYADLSGQGEHYPGHLYAPSLPEDTRYSFLADVGIISSLRVGQVSNYVLSGRFGQSGLGRTVLILWHSQEI